MQRRLGTIDVNAQMGTPAPASFSVNDVDWTMLGKLESDALAKAAIPQASIKHVGLAMTTDQPGQPALDWIVEIVEPSGEITKVIADKNRRHRARRPAGIAPPEDRLARSQSARLRHRARRHDLRPEREDRLDRRRRRRGRITVDDPAHGGQAATFDFTTDGVSRAGISFSLDSMGSRFALSDLAALDEQKLAALQADAFKRLSGGKTAYLESVTIGAHPFVRQAGARAIEVRLRNIPVDSVRAEYAWIVYDFSGHVLDSSGF